ncbi:MAG: CDP-diacylglycerol--glycerol-3-phosphate 3-phosphatidyltransferase [Anaeroplasmataceae bacterium]
MTLPNKLTLLRLLIVPIIVIVYYIPQLQKSYFWNIDLNMFIVLILFVIASFTDFLDGYLARKLNQITTFGKFADPLADKILTFAALLLLMDTGLVQVWIIIVILVRELIVSGIRLVAVEQGDVIAASKLGKWKTVFTMVAIIILFFAGLHNAVLYTGLVFLYIALVLTIVSGVDYFIKNRRSILKSV